MDDPAPSTLVPSSATLGKTAVKDKKKKKKEEGRRTSLSMSAPSADGTNGESGNAPDSSSSSLSPSDHPKTDKKTKPKYISRLTSMLRMDPRKKEEPSDKEKLSKSTGKVSRPRGASVAHPSSSSLPLSEQLPHHDPSSPEATPVHRTPLDHLATPVPSVLTSPPSEENDTDQPVIALRPAPSIERLNARPRSISMDSSIVLKQTSASGLEIPPTDLITSHPLEHSSTSLTSSSSSSVDASPPKVPPTSSLTVNKTASDTGTTASGVDPSKRSSKLFSSLRNFGSKHKRTASMGRDTAGTIHTHGDHHGSHENDEEGAEEGRPRTFSTQGVSSKMHRPSKSTKGPSAAQRKSMNNTHASSLAHSPVRTNDFGTHTASHRAALHKSIDNWIHCTSNLPLNLFPHIWKHEALFLSDLLQSFALISSSSSSSLHGSSSSNPQSGSALVHHIERQLRKCLGSVVIIKTSPPPPLSSSQKNKITEVSHDVSESEASSNEETVKEGEETDKQQEEQVENKKTYDPIEDMKHLLQTLHEALEEHFGGDEEKASSITLRFRLVLSEVHSNPLRLVNTDLPTFHLVSRFITELDLSKCDLSETLDMSAMPKLRRLSVRKNTLTGLVLTGLGSLDFLDISSNHFSSLPNFTYQSTSLKFLDVHTNQHLTDYQSVSVLQNLSGLDISDCDISVDVGEFETNVLAHLRKLGKLEHIWLLHNPIAMISPSTLCVKLFQSLTSLSSFNGFRIPDQLLSYSQELAVAERLQLELTTDFELIHFGSDNLDTRPIDLDQLSTYSECSETSADDMSESSRSASITPSTSSNSIAGDGGHSSRRRLTVVDAPDVSVFEIQQQKLERDALQLLPEDLWMSVLDRLSDEELEVASKTCKLWAVCCLELLEERERNRLNQITILHSLPSDLSFWIESQVLSDPVFSKAQVHLTHVKYLDEKCLRRTKILLVLVGDETSMLLKDEIDQRKGRVSVNETLSLYKLIANTRPNKSSSNTLSLWQSVSQKITLYLSQCYASRPFTEPFASLPLSQRLLRLTARRNQFLFPSDDLFCSQPYSHLRHAVWSCALPHDPLVSSSLNLISSRLCTLGSPCLSSQTCNYDLSYSQIQDNILNWITDVSRVAVDEFSLRP